MKSVVIISSSPRRGGNSDTLADAFLKGAQAANHQVKKVFLQDYQIAYCIGCGTCTKTGNGRCVQDDDMEEVLSLMVEADVIVFATPVYFYNMNAQMKTVLDRCCPRYTELSGKEVYIIMSAAEDDLQQMKTVLDSFQGFFNCIEGIEQKGIVYGLGVYEPGDIDNHDTINVAYAMGLHC